MNIKVAFSFLKNDLESNGPMALKWSNFGKLKGMTNVYHCHLKKGNPTYVAVWEIKDKTIKLMEVTYVGTHEKATY